MLGRHELFRVAAEQLQAGLAAERIAFAIVFQRGRSVNGIHLHSADRIELAHGHTSLRGDCAAADGRTMKGRWAPVSPSARRG